MDDFKVIYRILRYLQASLDVDEFDPEALSPSRLKVSQTHIDSLLIMMQDAGYITGVHTQKTLSDSRPHIIHPCMPRITIKGLEYLEENSMMRKAGNLIKGISEIIK